MARRHLIRPDPQRPRPPPRPAIRPRMEITPPQLSSRGASELHCRCPPANQIHRKTIMTVESFQTLVETLSERRLFHPFTIELTGGQRFEVDHPHALAYRDGLAFFLTPGRI